VAHPVVILGTAYFSLFLATLDYMLTTNSISYPTVYNFDLGQVALTSLAPSIGVWLGVLYGGYMNDLVIFLCFIGLMKVRSPSTQETWWEVPP
jgi:hypothetical protein